MVPCPSYLLPLQQYCYMLYDEMCTRNFLLLSYTHKLSPWYICIEGDFFAIHSTFQNLCYHMSAYKMTKLREMSAGRWKVRNKIICSSVNHQIPTPIAVFSLCSGKKTMVKWRWKKTLSPSFSVQRRNTGWVGLLDWWYGRKAILPFR